MKDTIYKAIWENGNITVIREKAYKVEVAILKVKRRNENECERNVKRT